jgi:tRNA(Ile)-lysidine synthase
LEVKLAESWPPERWCDLTLLLALSGGGDSVALFHAMRALKTAGPGRLVVGHVNHGLRGEESEADERFVRELCQRFCVPCDVVRASIDPAMPEAADGLETAARTIRYQKLEEMAARCGARYVVTAHTADDQAETILHRIVRGTGIHGLAGIPRARPLGPACTLIRPLLGLRRSELASYLADVGQSFRSDSSNADPRFTRNRLRHQLLPLMAAQFNSGIVDALLRLGSLAGEAQEVIDRRVQELATHCVLRDGSGPLRIQLQPLAGQPPYLLRELLIAAWREAGWPMQPMGFQQWDALMEMTLAMDAGDRPAASKRVLPGNIRAEVCDGELWLDRSEPPSMSERGLG